MVLNPDRAAFFGPRRASHAAAVNQDDNDRGSELSTLSFPDVVYSTQMPRNISPLKYRCRADKQAGTPPDYFEQTRSGPWARAEKAEQYRDRDNENAM
jgi:hypothetical protein